MNKIFNPLKDFNIYEESQIVIRYLRANNYYKIYNIKSSEILVLDDEKVLKNPWTYAYKIRIKRENNYIDFSDYIPFVDIDKIKMIFSDESFKIDNLDYIFTDDIIYMPHIHKYKYKKRYIRHKDLCLIYLFLYCKIIKN